METPSPPSISAVILTYNEELNLPACLKSLEGWCPQVFVVDSGSTDQTLAIAKQMGAEVVHHPFETHAKQWNWALKTLPLQPDWVLALDADHRISPGLREELCRALPEAPPGLTGYYLPRKQIFRGQWIRHGGCWPKYMLKLFRKGSAWSDERELVDARFYTSGKVRLLSRPLIEQNENEWNITFWLQKHLRYIDRLAQEEYVRRHHSVGWAVSPSLRGTPDQRTLWSKSLWYRLPPYIRPFLYYGYRYFIRLGILDGWEGALFHFLQGFWLRLMVDIRLAELERTGGGSP